MYIEKDFIEKWNELPRFLRIFAWMSPKNMCRTFYIIGRADQIVDDKKSLERLIPQNKKR